jgi:DNA replication and repair protein RecF
MALTDIRLQHFRSYQDAFFEFSPGVNIIVGPNASGKTNLLESVLVMARGGSYRAKDAELVGFQAEWSRLDAHDDLSGADEPRIVKLQVNPNGTVKKSFEIEGKPFLRLSQQKTLPAVVFEPDHLLMLAGSPDMRRTYLDDLIEQTVPGFGPTRRHYRRVLAQRNALLKQGYDVARNQIFVWNLRLSELAGRIVVERMRLLEQINAQISTIYGELSHAETHVEARYDSKLPPEQYETALLHRLEQTLERDCLLGFTANGPHRDDIRLLLKGHESQDTASRGENRTMVLALKIIELQLIAQARDQAPLLLLDDVFSELDGKRRQALTNFLSEYQTFITTTDADVVVKHFIETCNIIPLTGVTAD